MAIPYKSGFWQADDIHTLYWEMYGNPDGIPVIVLHGGPGGGRDTYLADYFNLTTYNILMFDQRGCGLSSPQGSTQNNTTTDLIQDIEGLRQHLNMGQVLVAGGSWGATLTLEYAKAHTDRCRAALVYSTFLGRVDDENWFINQTKRFYPDHHAELTSILDESEKKNIIAAFAKRLNSDDELVKRTAASKFMNYMTVLLSLRFENKSMTTPETIQEQDINGLKIFLHFSQNSYFLGPQGALENTDKISHLTGSIIHGRQDMDSCPALAWELSQRWKKATLQFVPACGHSDQEPAMKEALTMALRDYEVSLKTVTPQQSPEIP